MLEGISQDELAKRPEVQLIANQQRPLVREAQSEQEGVGLGVRAEFSSSPKRLIEADKVAQPDRLLQLVELDGRRGPEPIAAGLVKDDNGLRASAGQPTTHPAPANAVPRTVLGPGHSDLEGLGPGDSGRNFGSSQLASNLTQPDRTSPGAEFLRGSAGEASRVSTLAELKLDSAKQEQGPSKVSLEPGHPNRSSEQGQRTLQTSALHPPPGRVTPGSAANPGAIGAVETPSRIGDAPSVSEGPVIGRVPQLYDSAAALASTTEVRATASAGIEVGIEVNPSALALSGSESASAGRAGFNSVGDVPRVSGEAQLANRMDLGHPQNGFGRSMIGADEAGALLQMSPGRSVPSSVNTLPVARRLQSASTIREESTANLVTSGQSGMHPALARGQGGESVAGLSAPNPAGNGVTVSETVGAAKDHAGTADAFSAHFSDPFQAMDSWPTLQSTRTATWAAGLKEIGDGMPRGLAAGDGILVGEGGLTAEPGSRLASISVSAADLAVRPAPLTGSDILAKVPHLSVGYNDPALGYIELRAHAAEGGVHAALMTQSTSAGEALQGSLSELSDWMRHRQTPAERLTVFSAETLGVLAHADHGSQQRPGSHGGESGSSMAAGQGGGRGGAGDAPGGRQGGGASMAEWIGRPEHGTSPAIPTLRTEGNATGARLPGGNGIAVLSTQDLDRKGRVSVFA